MPTERRSGGRALGRRALLHGGAALAASATLSGCAGGLA